MRRARLVADSTGSPAGARPQPGAFAYQGVRAQRFQLACELVWGGHDDIAQSGSPRRDTGLVDIDGVGGVTTTSLSLVHRGGTGPGRRAAHRRHKRVSPCAGCVVAFGHDRGVAVQHDACGCSGVYGVGLTLATAHPPVRGSRL